MILQNKIDSRKRIEQVYKKGFPIIKRVKKTKVKQFYVTKNLQTTRSDRFNFLLLNRFSTNVRVF